MSWKIVGDEDRATFACDTADRGFGPLHETHHHDDRHAADELQAFADWLGDDARGFDEDELQSQYHDWVRAIAGVTA
jgi:hypothetical protein